MKFMIKWYHKPLNKGREIQIMCLQEEKLHPLEYADRERCQKESK